MRYLALTTLVTTAALSTHIFAQENEKLNYNLVNIQAEASRQISNDEMHAVLFIEKVVNSLPSFLHRLIS